MKPGTRCDLTARDNRQQSCLKVVNTVTGTVPAIHCLVSCKYKALYPPLQTVASVAAAD